ncbi:MAG: type II toxin-antitoxin system VapC family toxin [Bacteroidota bacterium]
MGTKCLIDSNVIIGYLDNKLPKKGMELVDIIMDDIPTVSVITKIEVLRFNTPDDSYKILQNFINDCVVLELNKLIVDKTIEIGKAHKIKLPDAIIAATALVNDLALITRNISDFKNIKDLELLNPWAEDNGNPL